MAQNVIEVKKVSKSFGGVKANVDITMAVRKGSITGIIGRMAVEKVHCLTRSLDITQLTLAQ